MGSWDWGYWSQLNENGAGAWTLGGNFYILKKNNHQKMWRHNFVTCHIFCQYYAYKSRVPTSEQNSKKIQWCIISKHIFCIWRSAGHYLSHGSRSKLLCFLAPRATWHATPIWNSYILVFKASSFTYLNFRSISQKKLITILLITIQIKRTGPLTGKSSAVSLPGDKYDISLFINMLINKL